MHEDRRFRKTDCENSPPRAVGDRGLGLVDLDRDALHVLVVSNHWNVKNNVTNAGVFVDRQVAALRQAGVKISTYDVGTSHSPVALFARGKRLRREARRLGVDIVHARYGTIVAVLSIFSGIPTVITYCGSDLLPGASVSLLRTWVGIFLSNVTAVFADRIICVSEELRRSLWWCRGKASVIPDGVDLTLFTPGDQVHARRELGWDLRRPILIIDAARDPGNKGLSLARTAMEVVSRQIPEAELKVVKGVTPDQMPLCYRAADVLVCASKQEGSPNVIKEALACNLPVVATGVGDIPDRLAGVDPSAVVPREAQAMGEAIARILLRRVRSNGRFAVDDLSIEKTAEKVMAVYKAAIGASN